MKRSPTSEYLRTKVLTASPAELRMMLLDGAVRYTEQAREALGRKDFERLYDNVTRSQSILMELLNALDPSHDPELCKRLSGLYTYMYTRLVTASSQRDVSIFDEVLKLLRYEQETWRLLLKKLAEDPAQAAHEPREPVAEAAAGGRLSVQG